MKADIANPRFFRLLALILILFTSLNPFLSPAAHAQTSPSEYFSFSYNIGGLNPPPQVVANQPFTVTVTGQVTCVKDLPGWIAGLITAVAVTGKITAQPASGAPIVLNPGYEVNISPVPKTAGQSLNINQSLPLQFPSGSAPGSYTVSGELISAIAQPLGLDVRTLLALPGSQTVGTVTLLAQPAPTPAPSPTPTPSPSPAPAQTPTPTPTPRTPPAVTTETSSSTVITTAQLNGYLSSVGTATSVYVSFEWGLSTGSYVAATIPPQSMNTTGPFSFTLNGLSAEFTYHYRAKAVGDGTIYGVDKTFASLSPCFIATAAFGTPTAEQINILREFRNNVLLKSNAGKDFISLYYKVSPTIADFISRHTLVRTVVREGFVEPLVLAAKLSEGFWNH